MNDRPNPAAFARPNHIALADEHWCANCEHAVILDDGQCSCGAVIDEAAFEAAEEARAETLCPFRTRDDWLDQPTYMRCDPRFGL
jgi:hypothetical protein